MPGATLGQLSVIVMGLVGLISAVKARRAARRSGAAPRDPAEAERQAARITMERRMASYLAARDDS